MYAKVAPGLLLLKSLGLCQETGLARNLTFYPVFFPSIGSISTWTNHLQRRSHTAPDPET